METKMTSIERGILSLLVEAADGGDPQFIEHDQQGGEGKGEILVGMNHDGIYVTLSLDGEGDDGDDYQCELQIVRKDNRLVFLIVDRDGDVIPVPRK